MRTAAFLIFLLCLGACFLLYRAGSVERDGTPAVSTATPEVPPPGVIARILGRDIRREDLDPPPGATTDLREFRKDKLAALIWKALEDKYETEHPLQPRTRKSHNLMTFSRRFRKDVSQTSRSRSSQSGPN